MPVKPPPRVLPLAATLALCLSSPTESQEFPLALGDADPLGAVYDCGPDVGQWDRQCQDFEVTCPNVAESAHARIRFAGDGDLGTIVVASGGAGKFPYGGAYELGDAILLALMDEGYRVVEMWWPAVPFGAEEGSGQGWIDGSDSDPDFTTDEGVGRLACRPATLLDRIFDNANLHEEGTPFCASGQSGGGSQFAYALSHFNQDAQFTAIVFTGGPPHASFIQGCVEEPACTEMTDGCYPGQDKWLIDKSYGEESDVFDPNDLTPGPCKAPGSFSEEFENQLELDSIAVRNQWDHNHPTTAITYLHGDNDGTSAVGQQLIHHDKLDADGTDVAEPIPVLNTEHRVPDTEEGMEAILFWLETTCVSE